LPFAESSSRHSRQQGYTGSAGSAAKAQLGHRRPGGALRPGRIRCRQRLSRLRTRPLRRNAGPVGRWRSNGEAHIVEDPSPVFSTSKNGRKPHHPARRQSLNAPALVREARDDAALDSRLRGARASDRDTNKGPPGHPRWELRSQDRLRPTIHRRRCAHCPCRHGPNRSRSVDTARR
jgi:hypothetical protein